MKKIFALVMAVICCTFISCDNDDWDTDPALEHVYYFCFEDWGPSNNYNKNAVVYDVLQGETVKIPVQFQSERIRSYDITVYYYVSAAATDLIRGVDYEIVDANGSALTPDTNGGFVMTFPKAQKGVQNVYVKALNGAKGSFNVQTFNPNDGEIKYPDNIINNATKDYEVRGITTNYRVKVNVQ